MSEDTVSISAAKLAASRANAQKSTGPRTPAGKLRSSQNALKHGRYAKKHGSYFRSLGESMRQLGENPEEFAEIEAGLRASLLPANALQEMLVCYIASLQWQRRRLERVLVSRISAMDRRIDRKIRLVLALQDATAHNNQSGKSMEATEKARLNSLARSAKPENRPPVPSLHPCKWLILNEY